MWTWRHFDLFIIEVWLFILENRVFCRWLQSDDWMAPLLSSSTFENKHSENHRRHISKASASEWRERVITVVQAGQEHVLNATQGPVHSNSKQATPVTYRALGNRTFIAEWLIVNIRERMYIHTTKEGQEESDEDQFRIYTRLSAKKKRIYKYKKV